jgi:4-hydroxy-L-threonine phosphate dehydrogenase PdxA
MEKLRKINNKILKYASRAAIKMWVKASLTHLPLDRQCLTIKTKKMFKMIKKVLQMIILTITFRNPRIQKIHHLLLS